MTKMLQTVLNFRQAFAVGFLFVGSKSDQRTIDEIHDTGFSRAGRTVARYDASGDCFHFFRFGGSKEFQLLRVGRTGCFVSVLGRS